MISSLGSQHWPKQKGKWSLVCFQSKEPKMGLLGKKHFRQWSKWKQELISKCVISGGEKSLSLPHTPAHLVPPWGQEISFKNYRLLALGGWWVTSQARIPRANLLPFLGKGEEKGGAASRHSNIMAAWEWIHQHPNKWSRLTPTA